MTVWMKVYDKETGKVEFDCSVNEIVKKVDMASHLRKRAIPLCIGDGSDAYQLQIERAFILSIGKD